MSHLSGDLIRHKLPTYTFGQSVISVQQTGSTNTELKRYARQGAPEGMLYIADEQLVGRGRLERSWQAPAESSLLTSLLFRPGVYIVPAQLQHITMLCALAILDAIETHTGLAASLKWPNDIIWDDQKKLGGILTESEIEGDNLSWVVVGLGLNVDIDFSSYDAAEPDRPGKPGSGHLPLAQTATSLSTILGENASPLRLPILQTYLKQTEQRYIALQHGVSPRFEWQRKLIGIGQPVTVTNIQNAEVIEGMMHSVDDNGALRLKQHDGTIKTIVAGDVTLR